MKKRLILLFAFIFCLIISFSALADVGNINDYGGGGWGGGGSDWGDSSWGGSSSYGGGTIIYGGGDGNTSFGEVVIAIIIIVIIVSVVTKGAGRIVTQAKPHVVDNTDIINAAITEVDENFSDDKFVAFAKEVFITLQQAWTEKDWSKIRPFEKEELFRQHEMQLNEYIRLSRTNYIERINVNQAYLSRYERAKEYEYMTVYMQVRMIDYIVDDKTGNVIKGSRDTDCYLEYLLTFMRKTGVKTDPASSGRSTVACPHCGAPTKITSAGKCEYCDFIVTTGEFDWVLSNIEGVKPNMNIDNSGVNIH